MRLSKAKRVWTALAFGVALGAGGCSGDEPKAEEPVAPAAADEADDAAAEGDGAANMDAGGEAAPMPAPAPEPAAPQPQEAPASTAAPKVPPQPSGSGGIISSGVKPMPADNCKKLPKQKDRDRCLQVLKEYKGQGN